MPRLVLASSSLSRRNLLQRLRVPFEIVIPDVDETPAPAESPPATASRLARAKAEAVRRHAPDAFIIGSDQVAEIDGERFGKPLTHANAVAQLQRMRGHRVVFHTALCLLDAHTGNVQSALVPVAVHYRDYQDSQIERYLAEEQPYQCAGSAKFEGLGIALVEKIEGDDPSALIGLPLMALVTMLGNAELEVL